MGVEVAPWVCGWARPAGNDNGPPAQLASNSDSSGGEFSLTHDIRPEDMLEKKGKTICNCHLRVCGISDICAMEIYVSSLDYEDGIFRIGVLRTGTSRDLTHTHHSNCTDILRHRTNGSPLWRCSGGKLNVILHSR